MRDLLAPWFATADRLAPRWRRCLSTIQAHGREKIRPIRLRGSPQTDETASLPSRADQLQLRETLELFALALHVNADAFIDAASPHVAPDPQAHREDRRLAIQLILDSRTPMDVDDRTFERDLFGYKAFFEARRASQETPAFRDACNSLLQKARTFSDSQWRPRFELGVHVRLSDGVRDRRTDLLAVLDVLAAIDRTVFRMAHVKVKVLSPAFSASGLERFFTHLYRLGKDTAVHVSLLLPSVNEDSHTFDEWKTLLEYVALQPNASPSDQDVPITYNVSVVFDRTEERLAIATLSALARATKISSLRLENAAQGRSRTQWLGHLMRNASIPSFTVHERLLLPGQLDVMTEAIPGHEIQRSTAERDPNYLLNTHSFLERITIDGGTKVIPWNALTEILESCPRLKALEIKTLSLPPNEPTAIGSISIRDAALKSLVLSVCAVAPGFIQALRPILECCGSQLEEFRLRCASPRSRLPTKPAGAEPFGDLLQKHCQSLKTLELRGVEAASVYDRIGLYPSSFAHLEVLTVHAVQSVPPAFVTALANPRLPLARSLRSLHVTDESMMDVDFVRFFLNMLQINNQLETVQLVVPRLASQAALIQELLTAHKAVSKNRRRLAVPNKYALLSALHRAGLRWQPELLAHVFAFAAPSKRRRVTVAFREDK